MFDLFDDVIEFEILGGFDNASKKDLLFKQGEELGLDVDEYDTLEELEAAIEEQKGNPGRF